VNMTDPGREEYTYCSREMSLLMIPKKGVATISEIDGSDYLDTIKYLADRGLLKFIKKMPLDVDGLRT
jgi:hypothetical protein